MNKHVLIVLPAIDFDPTEVSVPWKILVENGVKVSFATPHGQQGQADQVMVTGKRLGPLKFSLAADHHALTAYRDLIQDKHFQKPLKYEALVPSSFDGLLLPGGHAPGMRPYLESTLLHKFVRDFFAQKKPVGAICHGVVLAARSGILSGLKTTALPQWMELMAWNLTRLWMGSYYRTYSETVESEVRRSLKAPIDFKRGPWSFSRDRKNKRERGFTVRDGHYLSARWPGDAHRFAYDFLSMLG